MDRDPLSIDPQVMRGIGYRVVDMLVQRLVATDGERPLRTAGREEMERRLREAPPESPRDLDTILAKLDADILAFAGRWDHPRVFGYIPGSGTWPGALGDFIASALNVDATLWRESAGPSELELVVLDWFKDWIGYPEEAAGVLVSGGSAANMTALACAREALLGPMDDRAVAYFSDQTHSSMARAARILGFRPDQVRVLPVDERFRMRPESLETAIAADRRSGRRPLFVAATAGSTSTGSVDRLRDLAAISREQGVCLHVDAAYGGFGVLTRRGKEALDGLELAHSITLDPHKWLYQSIECGCLLVRDGPLLQQAFRITPDYLKDTEGTLREVNFSDRGMQLTRIARALKLWISLNYFGVDAFRAAIDRSLNLAREAQRIIENSPAFELVTPAWLSVVCFRRRADGVEDEEALEAINAELVRRLVESGEGLVSSTRLRGRYVLRLCVLNHTSRTSDVERVLRWLERAPVEPRALLSARPGVEARREQDVRLGWLGGRSVNESSLREFPLFASLDEDELRAVLINAYERTLVRGDHILERWGTSREFYVILEGIVEVLVDGERRDRMEAGDFFGEIAALDWGAGFAFPRLAGVIAATDTRLLVVPGTLLNRLMRTTPEVDRLIKEALRRRLPGL
jgi:aromatic-L-amino-acid/L-tryptophan decarboxylase